MRVAAARVVRRLVMTDLRTGHPSARHHPAAVLSAACEEMASELGREDPNKALRPCGVNYGPAQGEAEVLEWVASLVSRRSGEETRPETSRFLVTNGVSHALDLALSTLVGAGATVATERPTYFLAAAILKDHGCDVVTVGVDGDGLDVDALERGLRAGARLDAVYFVPRHGNPSGATLTSARRRQLAALSREFGFWVLADEAYDLLCWTDRDERPPRMAAFFDRDDDRLVAMGSFSKILAAPGLRLGWVEAPAKVVDRLAKRGVLRSGGGFAPFLSRLVARVDADAVLDGLVRDYRRNVDALFDELRNGPDLLRPLARPTGGYFVWIALPPGLDADALLDACSSDVRVLPGHLCDPGGRPFCPDLASPPLDRYIRLCFAMQDEPALRKAVRALLHHASVLAPPSPASS